MVPSSKQAVSTTFHMMLLKYLTEIDIDLCQELSSKCIVQDTDSSTIKILYRFDGNGYGSVPLRPERYAN